MRIVAFANTYGAHERVTVPEGDVVVFAGGYNWRRSIATEPVGREFIGWFAALPHKHKVFIGGPDDIDLYPLISSMPSSINYLENSHVIIEGLKFYGAPFAGPLDLDDKHTAFCARRVKKREYFEAIHADTNVLVTHMAPRGILDTTYSTNAGDEDLTQRVGALLNGSPGSLKAHFFGTFNGCSGSSGLYHNVTMRASADNGRISFGRSPTVVDL